MIWKLMPTNPCINKNAQKIDTNYQYYTVLCNIQYWTVENIVMWIYITYTNITTRHFANCHDICIFFTYPKYSLNNKSVSLYINNESCLPHILCCHTFLKVYLRFCILQENPMSFFMIYKFVVKTYFLERVLFEGEYCNAKIYFTYFTGIV